MTQHTQTEWRMEEDGVTIVATMEDDYEAIIAQVEE